MILARVIRLRLLLWALRLSVWISERLGEPELREAEERQRQRG